MPDNIIMPFSNLVTRLLEAVGKMDIKIDVLAPDHGPVWRENTGKIPEDYARWAIQKPERKAVIIYDTMWESTASMARAIGAGLAEGGIAVKVLPMKGCHLKAIGLHHLNSSSHLSHLWV